MCWVDLNRCVVVRGKTNKSPEMVKWKVSLGIRAY